MGLSQRACPSTGAFLNGRCASTAGFRTLQVKPQSRFIARSVIVACSDNFPSYPPDRGEGASDEEGQMNVLVSMMLIGSNINNRGTRNYMDSTS